MVMIRFLSLIVMFFCVVPQALEPASFEWDSRSLKGIGYVRIQCSFNGIPFTKVLKTPRAPKADDINLDKLETLLTEARIPYSKEGIQRLYSRLETSLKKEGLQIVETRPGIDDSDNSTVLSTIGIFIDAKEASPKENLIAASVNFTVSNWISTWFETDNVQTHVMAWWQNRLLVMNKDKFYESLDNSIDELLKPFLAQWKIANPTPLPPDTEKEIKKETPKQPVKKGKKKK